MKEETINNIIKAVLSSSTYAKGMNLTADTKFEDIPGFDSMSIVNFQMDLAAEIGEKAQEVTLIPEMSIGDLADLLESV